MASPARGDHVWVGAETGTLKGNGGPQGKARLKLPEHGKRCLFGLSLPEGILGVAVQKEEPSPSPEGLPRNTRCFERQLPESLIIGQGSWGFWELNSKTPEGLKFGKHGPMLQGINLRKKQATNYKLGDVSISRHEAVTAMCWGDPYESEIFVGCLDGSVRLFSTEKGKFTKSQHCPGGEGPFCGLCAIDNSLITCVESGLLKVWRDVSSENVEIQVGSGVCRMRQNPEQPHRVATGGKENCLKVWDLHQPQEPIFRAKNVRNDWLDLRVPVWERDMQFLPGSEKIVTCTGHHQVRLYDPSCPQRRPVLEATFGENPLTALSVTPDTNSVVVGSSRGDMAVIDLRQGRLLKCLKDFAGSVRAIQSHPVLPLVASCGLDRFLRVHNLHDKRLEHKVYLKSRLNCLLLTSREKWEDEVFDPSTDLQSDVKEEEDEADEIWNSMEVVVTKRKAGPQPSSDLGTGQHSLKALKKQKRTKKADA